MKTLLLLLFATLLPLARAVANFGANSFAGALSLGAPFSTSFTTNTAAFTAEAGEPSHDPQGTGPTASAWWTWAAPVDGFCTVETLDLNDPFSSTLNPVVAVYTGSTVNNLTRVAVGDNDVLPTVATASFFATGGSLYRIAVDVAGAGIPGNVAIRVRFTPAAARSYFTNWQSNGPNSNADARGLFSMRKTATGAVSGVLTMGGKRRPFKTLVSTTGYVTAVFPRPVVSGAPQLPPVTLIVDVSFGEVTFPSGGVLVDDGVSIHGVGALTQVNVFTLAAPAPTAGKYNAAITHNASTGTGIARATISPLGKVRFLATAGDGRKFSLGSMIVNGTKFPLHASFLGGKGYFYATGLAFDGAPDSIASSNGLYFRPPSAGATFYPDGIDSPATIAGRPYTPPAPGTRALGLLDASAGAGKLTTTDAPGELGPITQNLMFSTANVFTFTAPTVSPKLRLNPLTGVVTGSIISPAGVTRRLSGLLYDTAGTVRVRGFVTGRTRTAAFLVGP